MLNENGKMNKDFVQGDMMDTNKEYTLDEIAAMLPENSEKTYIIDKFLSALEFVKTVEEFKTVDMQRYLKCGYGNTCRVIDALILLGAIENLEVTPVKYKVSYIK